jgi:hypothetical protein
MNQVRVQASTQAITHIWKFYTGELKEGESLDKKTLDCYLALLNPGRKKQLRKYAGYRESVIQVERCEFGCC